MDANKIYESWLREFGGDPETKQELLAIGGNAEEIADRFGRELEFGTGGMRGVIGMGTNRINIYNVRRVTRAFAKYILTVPGGAEKGVAIAFDSRNKSPEFAREAALVLCAAGIQVHLYRTLRPVPVLSFTVRHLSCIAGICITASHNPPQYNGYKAYWTDGAQMPPDSVTGLTDRLPGTTYDESRPMDEAEAVSKGLLHYVDSSVDDAYIRQVKSLAICPDLTRKVGREFKLVYSPLNGSGNLPVRRVLREIGFENVYVVPEQENPDGNFPTLKVPNPEDPAAFTLALALQKEKGADLCIATDPDCDRVGVACLMPDGSAKLLNGNQIGCLLLDYIVSRKREAGTLPDNGACVSTIVSTGMAKKISETNGIAYIPVLTGFKFIAEQIKQFEQTHSHTFLFGFEESYGFLSGTNVRDKDGVNAVMLLAECAAWYRTNGMSLIDGIENLYRKYGFYGDKVASFQLPGLDGLAKMRRIMAALRASSPAAFGGAAVIAVRDYQIGIRRCGTVEEQLTLPPSDVLYYELEGDVWVCVRPSGTEPKLKLYANAVTPSHEQTEAKLTRIVDAAKELLKELEANA